MHYEQIPEELFELNKELGLHPDIQQAADIRPSDNLTTMLARVAAILGYSVSSNHTLEHVCDRLLQHLRARRLGLKIPELLLPARLDPIDPPQ